LATDEEPDDDLDDRRDSVTVEFIEAVRFEADLYRDRLE
jgi:hypothetical protein